MGGNTKLERVPEGARRQWAADRALRPPMRSPGRPEPSRGVQRRVWQLSGAGGRTGGGAVRGGGSVAQWKAQQTAKRPKTAKLVSNPRLRKYVQERLSGSVCRPDGTVVAGPEPPAWKGLNKPHRQDRRWVTAWSPEQIAHRLRID